MKANGSMTIVKVKVWNATLMVISMKETLSEEKLMERACINGPTERFTKVNGFKALKKAMACGKEYLVIRILASGRTTELISMASTSARMAIDTKVIGSTALSTVKAQISLLTVMSIRALMQMARLTELAFTNGKMVAFIKENSRTA